MKNEYFFTPGISGSTSWLERKCRSRCTSDLFYIYVISGLDEISRLTNKNQEYEARLNQLEATRGLLASRDQQEQHVLPSLSNEIKQRHENTAIKYFVFGKKINMFYVYIVKPCLPIAKIRASGNLASGFYTVKGLNGITIETIYCDFSFLPGATGISITIQ